MLNSKTFRYGTWVVVKETQEKGQVLGTNGGIIFVCVPDLTGRYCSMYFENEIELSTDK